MHALTHVQTQAKSTVYSARAGRPGNDRSIIFLMGRTENRNYSAHAAICNNQSLVFKIKLPVSKKKKSLAVHRLEIALFRNYDYGNGRPAVIVLDTAALQSTQSVRAAGRRCSCRSWRGLAVRLAHANRNKSRQATQTEVAAVCNSSFAAQQSQICVPEDLEVGTRVAQIAR